MLSLTTQETELINKKTLREKCIERIEVLNKVKELFLIPDLEIMTIRQVAEYYEVGFEAIKSCYKDNKNEIDEDGSIIKTCTDILIVLKEPLVKTQAKTIFQLSEGVTFEIPNRGIRCFSKRAILRIGMLLRDSTIAKEIRTQLLNSFEYTTTEQKTKEINNEINFVDEIGKAYMSGDINEFTIATQKYIVFQNRHIEQIENDNKVLAGEILEWTDRASLNKAVRILSGKAHQPFGHIFNQLYDELRYKHGIGLSQRGGSPLIQHIREDEWSDVIQSFSAICEANCCSPFEILKRSKL